MEIIYDLKQTGRIKRFFYIAERKLSKAESLPIGSWVPGNRMYYILYPGLPLRECFVTQEVYSHSLLDRYTDTTDKTLAHGSMPLRDFVEMLQTAQELNPVSHQWSFVSSANGQNMVLLCGLGLRRKALPSQLHHQWQIVNENSPVIESVLSVWDKGRQNG